VPWPSLSVGQLGTKRCAQAERRGALRNRGPLELVKLVLEALDAVGFMSLDFSPEYGVLEDLA
jgi:hypothetical protein